MGTENSSNDQSQMVVDSLLTQHQPQQLQQQQIYQQQASFCEEIDFQEIKRLEVLGRGTYGLVQKAVFREKIVAVKMIDSEMERRAFFVEVKQLSRVHHENIVKLYGACTQHPVCLVMEFAEGGSLYNVLHNRPRPAYKTAHAMSWALQCARGVEYLHNLKPKALVHRDLKPPNLLLVDGGRKLKICDFGTACDLQTYMTNNKGSAAWMAPEVFEGRNYTEKCDVFSWGIILWEVLTRLRPFAELGGPAFRIMWAVHEGCRPQLIRNCPKPIEVLMVSCWDRDPAVRPAMSNVVLRMDYLMQFFKGAGEPIVYTDSDDSASPSSAYSTNVTQSQPTFASQTEGDFVPTLVPEPEYLAPNVKEDHLTSLQSAPASLAGSEENLHKATDSTESGNVACSSSTVVDNQESDNSGGAKAKGHRKTGSFDLDLLKAIAQRVNSGANGGEPSKSKPPKGPDRTNMSLNLTRRYAPTSHNQNGEHKEDSPAAIPMAWIYLESHLQPMEPCPENKESMQIYREHCQMAEDYLKMQEEIILLSKRKQELLSQLDKDVKEEHQISTNQEKYSELLRDKEQLLILRDSLKQQLGVLRKDRQRKL